MANDFEGQFFEWVDKALKTVPDSVNGFAFNLFERPWLDKVEPKYGVELVGSSEFSFEDEDWACEEIFEAKPRSLEIPISYSTQEWEMCLNKMAALIKMYMESSALGAVILTNVEGVGIGFVDGDLRLL